MKKKFLAVPFLCAVAFTSAGIALTSASALDDSLEALTVQNVNYSPDDPWGNMTIVNFGITSGVAGAVGNNFASLDTTYVSYVDKTNTSQLSLFENYGTSGIFNRNGRAAAVGDLITIKQGFTWVGDTQTYEMKADVSYLYATENKSWVVFAPTYLSTDTDTATVLVDSTTTVAFTTDYSVAPLTCTVDNTSIASVTSDGLTVTVTGLAEGDTTLTVACGTQTKTIPVSVSVPKANLTSISVEGNLTATVGDTTIDCSAVTGTKHYDDNSSAAFTVDASMISGDYDLNTAGTYTVTITADGKSTTATLVVNPRPALTINSVNYVSDLLGWGSSIAIDMGVDIGTYGGAVDTTYIAYVDKTGANVLSGAMTFGSNMVLNNQGRVAQAGDIVTLKAGLVWVGKELKSDVSFIYDVEGSSWLTYSVSALTASTETVSVHVGETANVTFATSPTAYASVVYTGATANSGVASVAMNGGTATVSGVAVGTTSLTVTCNGVSKTVNVEVTEAPATLDSITVAGELTASQGASTIDYSTLVGTKHYSDGVTETFAIDASMVSGSYDLNTVGTYSLTITYGGKQASVTLNVVSRPALTISDFNVDGEGWGFMIRFDTTASYYLDGTSAEAAIAYLEVKDSAGNSIIGNYNWLFHESYIFGVQKNNEGYEIGSTITLKQGLVFNGCELKETVTYVYAKLNTPLGYYDAAIHTPTAVTVSSTTANKITYVKATLQLAATVEPSTAATTVKYVSLDPSVATVDSTGLVKGISTGEVTIRAYAGNVYSDIKINVEPELEFQNKLAFTNVYTLWVQKDGTISLPTNFTVAPLYVQDGNDVYGAEFALSSANCTLSEVDTTTVGEKKMTASVSFEGTTYDMEITVNVYVVDEMIITELAVVEWFAFATFIEYPASATNVANITNGSLIPDAYKMTYTRANGETIPVGVYNLGNGNIAIMPQFPSSDPMTLETFNQAPYYQAGDMITLRAGLTGYLWTGDLEATADDNGAMKANSGMIVPECVLSQTVSYRFDGTIWMLYVEYTDFNLSESVEVVVGKQVSVGAVRVPDNATVGTFKYESSDTSIATVNANGRVTGVKEGTVTVTVTLEGGAAGTIVKTITVTVTDGIVKFEIPSGTVLTVSQGIDNLDLSQVPATFTWASGKTESVDLTNATVIGYNKDQVGETEVTIRVTVGEQIYQTQLTVVVTEDASAGSGSVSNNGGSTGNGSTDGSGSSDSTSASAGCSGCSSSMHAVSIAAAMLIGAAAILILKKKTER